MERLWSYLRRFGRMTKEMRPAHRTDILTHALVHYGQKTKAKLGREIKKHAKNAHISNVYREATCYEGEKGQRDSHHCK